MSKYDPLHNFLRAQKFERVPMSFSDIERVLKLKLPPSKMHRAWWSNNPSNNVMTKQWLDAGFESSEVDIENERIVFARKGTVSAVGQPKAFRASIFGCLKGMATFAPGFEATQPAFDMDDWQDELLSKGSHVR